MGTVCVLSSPLAEAAAAVRTVEQELRRRARARVFYVALMEKVGDVAAETLRDQFELVDASSLFLIPVDDAERAQDRIRDLFARIVP